MVHYTDGCTRSRVCRARLSANTPGLDKKKKKKKKTASKRTEELGAFAHVLHDEFADVCVPGGVSKHLVCHRACAKCASACNATVVVHVST